MSQMITFRMPDERVEQLDALVASGAFPTRAAAVRAAIDQLLASLESEAIDRAIIDGYTRIPQTDEDVRWAEAAARRSIAEEPW